MWGGATFAALLTLAVIVTRASRCEESTPPPILSHSPAGSRCPSVNDGSLKLMTLNVAHGRGNGINQVFQSAKRISENVDAIGALLRRVAPDVAVLQEADGSSFWSGDFNHVSSLAEKGGFSHSVHGLNVKGAGIAFGTAILSRRLPDDARCVTFDPSPPTFSKGFVSASLPFEDDPASRVTVVSAHLDFSRNSVREKQVQKMVETLEGRIGPPVILGDFNAAWEEGSPVRTLARRLRLKAYKPEEKGHITFPTLKTRLDWVLISEDLEFVSHEILPDVVSDHLAAVAVVRKKARDNREQGGKPPKR